MNATTRNILKFILKVLATALPVLAVAVVWYVATDPFKVLRHYDPYFDDPVEVPVRVGINKGLVTLSNFDNRRAEGIRYNGFIFGSSISCYYDAYLWARLADSTGRVVPYHFDSSGETVGSMARKVEYLRDKGVPPEYALVILDPIIMNSDIEDGPGVANPPQLHRNLAETLKYHYDNFRGAVNADFLKSWIPYRTTGKAYYNGRNRIFEPQPIIYDPLANQESIPTWDSIISCDPQAFYAEYPLMEVPDSITVGPEALTPEKKSALKSIAEIFEENGTDYQIIISPNRSKVIINPADLQALQQIFKPERVHDYTLSMAKELETDTLLYDNTHYRACFANRLLKMAYGNK